MNAIPGGVALEWTAVALGLVYLLGAVQQWRGCWIAGGLSALLFLIVFWSASLPMQALLQAYYVAIAVHGWWHWGHGQRDGDRAGDSGGAAPGKLPVQRWPLRYHLAGLALVAVLSAATVTLRGAQGELSATLDAVTSWGSALATWMVARKVLENWWYWIVIDSVAVLLYLDSDLTATAGLYVLYTIIAFFGWLRWRQTPTRNKTRTARSV